VFLMTDMTNIIIVLSVIRLSLYLRLLIFTKRVDTAVLHFNCVFCDNTTFQFVGPKKHCIIHKGRNLYMHHVQANVFKNGKYEKT
jgi:hypothetical protein